MKSAVLAACVLLGSLAAFGEEKSKQSCLDGGGGMHRTVRGYRVAIEGVSSQDDPENRDCRLQAKTIGGRVIFEEVDHAIEAVKEVDLDADGSPEFVFEGYSGGAHCCWTYWFVSLGADPGLFATIENERGVSFHKIKNGRYKLRTTDGAFDYFDGLCHACAPFPNVVLRLENRQLTDISPHFQSDYGQEIAKARSRLDNEDFDEFVTLSHYDDGVKAKYGDAARDVLTIVLAYLYSGREAEAWKALAEMWPAPDQARMKKLILETRAKGVLSQLKVSQTSRP